ncbi:MULTISPECIES: UDP-2,4-diacetamido-2,4,6-trideoxy-beta-L-altropyranose hydrolase [Pseudomonas]|uniref:UDP-2,4-diacetamido-2,4, 6-trideoxy-beta-L-altropyranose hydrolase n=1 Tax=Pseudomonas taiwanensis TaxID=470150 RepID=A0ABR6V708_9PSED|nr:MULTISPECIES: UDP-2,4-diacetamido-2,4,6-trideoxy-beta-L-altropyranose hydrolase [Pseudomonas]AVD90747.1 UDP-2,4-diacetamido-2,4,6-trideoxy-beta-L-altropyranose hydrolase [Pseudomonas sp. SWI44]MBC3476314.1 UDP-2,4-diacetamido-2,4,6-trideoxy-beta-L-altropyranose hydrolase [Pseudomonas taiwanensis]MBC3493996.1 UDP-2,4-diacetamido-2,4,6-trideoxy-beta-L-altropyranose hydrolase [Pseudomonas taiwanensis]
MKIVFRVDASFEMGTGHVMRCVTLAKALRDHGHHCLFIGREHPGNMNGFIRDHEFEVCGLPLGSERDSDLPHSHWLGASQFEDQQQCRAVVDSFQPDWLVVDHYALDERWESVVVPAGCRVMVIDDLADRKHRCDLLLDQNLGRQPGEYAQRVPDSCCVLTGPSHALLRSEFAELRPPSLQRRAPAKIREILVSLGGVDQHNHTGSILTALTQCELSEDIRFTVIMGAAAPHLESVRSIARDCPWPVEVLSGINDMARRMVDADLAIGAGGGTSWERCCLGLPTLLVILAENQRPAGNALQATGAVQLIDPAAELASQLNEAIRVLSSPEVLGPMVEASSRITDGLGVSRVIRVMETEV